MISMIWIEAQMRQIEPHFLVSHGVPRVDSRKIIIGLIVVIRNGLRWRDAPCGYGLDKTIYNQFISWSRLGMFNKIVPAIAANGGKPDQLMIDPRHLKAHRTTAILLKKGLYPDVSDARKAARTRRSMPSAMARAGHWSCCSAKAT